MKDLIAVDLLLPTTTLHFFGPRPASASSSSSRPHTTHPKRHKLRGKLRIVTSKPIKLRQVQIKFKGFTHLSWRDRCRNGGAPAGSAAALGASLGLMSERMEAWKTLRKSKQVLLEDATLPAGVTDLGFEMSVPGHLPHSYLSEFLEVGYAIVAKMTPQGKFGKPVRVERRIEILKTLMPKDVSCGYVNGYMVPTVIMSGQRESTGIRWKFNVPKFVCLDDENGVEFMGAFFKTKRQPSRLGDLDRGANEQDGEEELKIERILVDIIQEELYRLSPTDTPEQSTGNDIASFLFPTNNPPKRQLVTPQTHPSTYLHPPWSCPIHFSFPFLPPTSTTVGASKATRSAPLTYTLDSPFLLVSHFVRLRVDFSNPEKNPPLCLGLPVKVTRRIGREEVMEAGGGDPEGLPSYSSVVRDGERLPDYTADGENDENSGVWSEEDDEGTSYPTTIRRIEAIRIAAEQADHQLFMTGAGGAPSESEARSGVVPPLSLYNGSDSDTDPMVTHIEPTPVLAYEPETATAPSASSLSSRRRVTEEIINRLPSVPAPSVQPSVPLPSSRRSRRDTEIAVHERSMADFFEIRRSSPKRPSTTSRVPERAGTGTPPPSRSQSRPILRSRSTGELRGPALLGGGGAANSMNGGGRPRGGTHALAGTSQNVSSAAALFHSLTTS